MAEEGKIESSRSESRDIAGIILAGGYSKRFGREKSEAEWRGKRLIDHAADCLRGHCRQLAAVCRQEQNLDSTAFDKVAHDDPAYPPGPLRGIVAGLLAVDFELAFVIACDAPSVQPGLLRALAEKAAEGRLAVIPQWEGRCQVLTALYQVKAVRYFIEALERGVSSPLQALAGLPFSSLSEQECRRADPGGLSFINVNTPADLILLEEGVEKRSFNALA